VRSPRLTTFWISPRLTTFWISPRLTTFRISPRLTAFRISTRLGECWKCFDGAASRVRRHDAILASKRCILTKPHLQTKRVCLQLQIMRMLHPVHAAACPFTDAHNLQCDTWMRPEAAAAQAIRVSWWTLCPSSVAAPLSRCQAPLCMSMKSPGASRSNCHINLSLARCHWDLAWIILTHDGRSGRSGPGIGDLTVRRFNFSVWGFFCVRVAYLLCPSLRRTEAGGGSSKATGGNLSRALSIAIESAGRESAYGDPSLSSARIAR
jgi:hypothetical protein